MSRSHRKPIPLPSAAQRSELARAKRAARWVGLILPLTLLTAVLALVLIWLPRLPNPAATHWSGDGPDGFGSPWSYVWIVLLAGHGMVLMMWAFIAYGSRMPAPSPKRVPPVWSGFQRFLAAFSAGFAALMAITTLSSVGVQLDLADPADADNVGLPVAIGYGAWAAVSAVGWFVQPNVVIRRAASGPSEPLPLANTERAAWFGEVRPSRAFLWLMGVAMLLMIGSTVLVFATDAPLGVRIMMAVLTPLVAIFGVTGARFRVRIDDSGLAARSLLGWPTFRLAAADAERAAALAAAADRAAGRGGRGDDS